MSWGVMHVQFGADGAVALSLEGKVCARGIISDG